MLGNLDEKIYTQKASPMKKIQYTTLQHFYWRENLKSLRLLTCKMFTVVLRKLLIFFCYWSWSTISENQKDSFKHESIIFVSCPTNRQKEKEKYSPLNPFLGLTPKYFFMDIKVMVTTKCWYKSKRGKEKTKMKTTNTTKDDVSLFFLVQNYIQNYNFLTCTGTCMQVGLVLY